jgi:foldase protein PrsA
MLLNRRLHKWMFAMMALLLVVSVLSACGKKKDTGATTATGKPTDVIATYKDNGKVTRAEFDSFVNVNKLFNPQLAQYITEPAFQQDILKQLITFRILSAKADDKVKADADKQVADQMKQIQDYLSKQEGGMDKALKDNNITLKDIESLMKISYYSMMSLEAKVTDQQIQDDYKTRAAAHEFDVATVSHILIATQDAATQKDIRTIDEALARAKEVLDKLKKGGDFAALAKEYSDDPGSKDAGGTYKDADINQWVTEFKQAAVDLPLNTLSDPPVKTTYGYHVMKVESRSVKKLDDVKAQIKSEIAQKSLGDFADKELPGLIESNKLPMPSAAPAASTAPATSPAASPTASPAAK